MDFCKQTRSLSKRHLGSSEFTLAVWLRIPCSEQTKTGSRLAINVGEKRLASPLTSQHCLTP